MELQATWVDEKGLQRRKKVRFGEKEEVRIGLRTTMMIKIKTSKKQLEELLPQVNDDLEGLRQLLTWWEGQHKEEEENKRQ